MRLHRFGARAAGELLERFLALRERMYAGDYFFNSDADLYRLLIDYYARREDYRFELVLAARADGEDVARMAVGRCTGTPWAFFGLFECPDDAATFERLTTLGCGIAAEFGAASILGPWEFNSLHHWMFQLDAAGRERWVGDLYHRPYYPALFRRAGWEIVDEAVSGELSEEAEAQLLARFAHVPERLARQGFRFVRRGDVPDDDLVRLVWELANESFTADIHRYRQVEYEFFHAVKAPLLERLDDPFSIAGFLKDGRLAAYGVSFPNFIDQLCNPDGAKPPPAGVVREPRRFSVNVTAVAPQYRRTLVLSGLTVLAMRHVRAHYGHPLAWRRTSVANPGTTTFRELSRITHRHVTLGRALDQRGGR